LRLQKYSFFHYPQEKYGEIFSVFYTALIFNKKKSHSRIDLFPTFAPLLSQILNL